MQLYRRLTFGNLVEFNVLDTRQYRSDQACGDRTRINCSEALESTRTITGQKQEQWLFQGLAKSQARWNILAQQVFMAQRDFEPGAEVRLSMDAWDGYVGSRDRLFQFLQQSQPANPIVLTGDVHTNWVADLKADFNNPNSKTIGTEFVGTSISSGGNGSDTNPNTEAILAENPHIKFFNNQRGYVRCELTPQRWQSDYRTVAAVTTLDAPITTRASFVVENGRPGAQRLQAALRLRYKEFLTAYLPYIFKTQMLKVDIHLSLQLSTLSISKVIPSKASQSWTEALSNKNQVEAGNSVLMKQLNGG